MVDKAVQTVIQRRIGDDICLKPADEEKIFHSLLEFVPYQEIQDHSIRVINLPKPKLTRTEKQSQFNFRDCLLLDDDGLSELCVELRECMRSSDVQVGSFHDGGTQTRLHVQPHVLENDGVANVTVNAVTQTSNDAK